MPLQGEYMGMMLTLDDLDHENLDFFRYCFEGDFRLQRRSGSVGHSQPHFLPLASDGPLTRL